MFFFSHVLYSIVKCIPSESCTIAHYKKKFTGIHVALFSCGEFVQEFFVFNMLSFYLTFFREPLEDIKLDAWLRAPKPKLEEDLIKFTPNDQLKAMQAQMAKLYLKQKAQGSIIDISQEEKRFLVTTQSPTDTAETTEDSPSSSSPQDQLSGGSVQKASREGGGRSQNKPGDGVDPSAVGVPVEPEGPAEQRRHHGGR